jgi:hypothetical protein
MSRNYDTAGLIFAGLILVLAIPFAIVYLRGRRELDPRARVYAGLCVAAALILGVVNAIRSLGLLTNDPAYWTFEYGFGALFWVMFLRFSLDQRRKA